MSDLKFASERQALQYLANVTGKCVKIAEDSAEVLWKIINEDMQMDDETFGPVWSITEDFEGTTVSTDPVPGVAWEGESGKVELKPGTKNTYNLRDLFENNEDALTKQFSGETAEDFLSTNSEPRKKFEEVVTKKSKIQLPIAVDMTFEKYGQDAGHPFKDNEKFEVEVSGIIEGENLKIRISLPSGPEVDKQKVEVEEMIIEKEIDQKEKDWEDSKYDHIV